jgi:levanase/fructan beta-fructosidase
MPFNQQVSFPCDLTLHDVNGSLRIFRKPIPEISELHSAEHAWINLTLAPGVSQPLDVAGGLYHILADVDIPNGAEMVFKIRGESVILTSQTMACNSGPASTLSKLKKVEILVDRTSIESFANDGEVSISTCFRPANDALSVECARGSAMIKSLHIYELASIWGGGQK